VASCHFPFRGFILLKKLCSFLFRHIFASISPNVATGSLSFFILVCLSLLATTTPIPVVIEIFDINRAYAFNADRNALRLTSHDVRHSSNEKDLP